VVARAILAIVVAGSSLVACARSGDVFFPTHDSNDFPSSAIEGVLVSEGPCLMIRTGPDADGDVQPLWPERLSLDRRNVPQAIVDENGRVLAEVGTWVLAGGGNIPGSMVEERFSGYETLRETCDPDGFWFLGPDIHPNDVNAASDVYFHTYPVPIPQPTERLEGILTFAEYQECLFLRGEHRIKEVGSSDVFLLWPEGWSLLRTEFDGLVLVDQAGTPVPIDEIEVEGSFLGDPARSNAEAEALVGEPMPRLCEVDASFAVERIVAQGVEVLEEKQDTVGAAT
jgi:hypothetical protein